MAELNEKALLRAREAYNRKWADISDPTPTEEPAAGGGALGYGIMAYLDAVKTDSELESDLEILRNYCQQLLDVIENYNISEDAPDEELDLIAHISSAVDPAHEERK